MGDQQPKACPGWLYPGTVPNAALPAQESSSAISAAASQGVHTTHELVRVAPAPAKQSSSREQYNMFTHPRWHGTYPGFPDGSFNYVAQWGEDGEPYWQFQLKSAAARVRHAAGEAARPSAKHLRNPDRELLRRVMAPSLISRCKDTACVFDVLDQRVADLIPTVNGLPHEERVHVIEEICENLDHSVRQCGHFADNVPAHPVPQGVAQAADVLDMLNRVEVDTVNGIYARTAS